MNNYIKGYMHKESFVTDLMGVTFEDIEQRLSTPQEEISVENLQSHLDDMGLYSSKDIDDVITKWGNNLSEFDSRLPYFIDSIGLEKLKEAANTPYY